MRDIVSFHDAKMKEGKPRRMRGHVNRICSDGKTLEISVDSREDYSDVFGTPSGRTTADGRIHKMSTFRKKSEDCKVEINSKLAPTGPGEIQFRGFGL